MLYQRIPLWMLSCFCTFLLTTIREREGSSGHDAGTANLFEPTRIQGADYFATLIESSRLCGAASDFEGYEGSDTATNPPVVTGIDKLWVPTSADAGVQTNPELVQ